MLEGMAGPDVDMNRPDFEKRLEKAAQQGRREALRAGEEGNPEHHVRAR